ncbi:unnamed protein product [Meganyctiphanes norvegica]|uniref:Uncharacterized protein n=1 Tax=Meganyctiphanes norvegica TaxID=48144 RepID=A0AAV2PT89_MEGNR
MQAVRLNYDGEAKGDAVSPFTSPVKGSKPYKDLVTAVKHGDVNKTQEALSEGADPNTCIAESIWKSPMLLVAVYKGHLELVKLLLENGADLHRQDQLGRQAVHEAATCGRLEILQLLHERGAIINAINKLSETPLHKAAFMNREDIVHWLLEHGASPTMTNSKGLTPADEAHRYGYNELAFMLKQAEGYKS